MQIIAFSLQNLLVSYHSCSLLQPKLPQAPNTLITNFNFNHGIISRAIIYTNLRVLIQLPFIFDRHHFDVVNEIGKFWICYYLSYVLIHEGLLWVKWFWRLRRNHACMSALERCRVGVDEGGWKIQRTFVSLECFKLSFQRINLVDESFGFIFHYRWPLKLKTLDRHRNLIKLLLKMHFLLHQCFFQVSLIRNFSVYWVGLIGQLVQLILVGRIVF